MNSPDETTRLKEVEFYAANVGAWLNTSLEHDKSILTLSAGGIGLLVEDSVRPANLRLTSSDLAETREIHASRVVRRSGVSAGWLCRSQDSAALPAALRAA